MPGSLLFGADGSLVYGPDSNRLLFKPRDKVVLTASSVSAFLGSVSESGWSQANYSAVLEDAWDDFLEDSSLGSAGYQDVASGLATDYGYGSFVWGRYYGLRFTFSMTTTQKARLSSIAVASQYAAWWLKGYRYTSTLNEAQDFVDVDGSIRWLLTEDEEAFDDGQELIDATADKTVNWTQLNSDQVDADATLSDMKWVQYPLAGDVVERVMEYDSTTIYLWAWASGTTPQYLGNKSEEFRVGTSGSYGWEIVCGPVNATMFAPTTPLIRLRIGQDA